MTNTVGLFPKSYEDSRKHFLQYAELIKKRWASANLFSHPLNQPQGEKTDSEGDLTLDWIDAPALERQEKLLIFTAGEHGIESYVGAGMFELFLDEFMPLLDPATTGLLIVHTINPWGMKHFRRTNQNNVDLNRNFVRDASYIDPSFNSGYATIDEFINPKRVLGGFFSCQVTFLVGFLEKMIKLGFPRFNRIMLLGQYRFPKGIHYGGDCIQEETRVITDLYREHVARYSQILHLDMHTGYGPRYQMSLVNSSLEGRESADLQKSFAYPLIVKTNSSDFYSLQGDMIDFMYSLIKEEYSDKRLYATSFEFGTYGDGPVAVLNSICTMILENQMYWYGTKNRSTSDQVLNDFMELYNPQDSQWQAKAIEDAREAFRGILKAEGYLG